MWGEPVVVGGAFSLRYLYHPNECIQFCFDDEMLSLVMTLKMSQRSNYIVLKNPVG